MTLPEFIALWQAQPFRPFRLHTTRGVYDVAFPLQVALTPAMRVALALDGEHVESFALEEIGRGEPHGAPVDLAQLISSLPPERISRAAELLSAAVKEASAAPEGSPEPPEHHDPGVVTFLTATEKDTGIFLIYAVVTTRDGTQKLFSNVGTRWNVHGLEPFENGTSVYLHHLDHPRLEQRVIVWPPDKVTWDSFAEAKSPEAFATELRRRDAELTHTPARPAKPSAAYLRRIVPEFPLPEIDGRFAAFGEDPDDEEPRYGLELVPHDLGDGQLVANPVVTDRRTKCVLFDLRGTPWNASQLDVADPWRLHLAHAPQTTRTFGLRIDPARHTAAVDDVPAPLPLAFIERHLINFIFHARWDVMLEALRAGPIGRGQPEIVVPLARGYRVELWPGDPVFPLPFLQPRILDPAGETVFDLRQTAWATVVRPHAAQPVAKLLFVSHEREQQDASAGFPLVLDLVTRVVTCPKLEGFTTLGGLQRLAGQVRGQSWWQEDLPRCLARGRLLPRPDTQ